MLTRSGSGYMNPLRLGPGHPGPIQGGQDQVSRALDAHACGLDRRHGLIPTAGPARHVAEGPGTGVQAQRVADDEGDRLGLQFRERPIGGVGVQQRVRQLVCEGFDSVRRLQTNLDADASK